MLLPLLTTLARQRRAGSRLDGDHDPDTGRRHHGHPRGGGSYDDHAHDQSAEATPAQSGPTQVDPLWGQTS